MIHKFLASIQANVLSIHQVGAYVKRFQPTTLAIWETWIATIITITMMFPRIMCPSSVLLSSTIETRSWYPRNKQEEVTRLVDTTLLLIFRNLSYETSCLLARTATRTSIASKVTTPRSRITVLHPPPLSYVRSATLLAKGGVGTPASISRPVQTIKSKGTIPSLGTGVRVPIFLKSDSFNNSIFSAVVYILY